MNSESDESQQGSAPDSVNRPVEEPVVRDDSLTTESPVPKETATSKDAKKPAVRKTLGKYLLKQPIGSGGMGTVYLAVDSELNRTAALKILPKSKAANPLLVKRFELEAQSASQLNHENIVAIYETGQADGYLYIALEYVEGVDVAKLVKDRGALSIRRSMEIIKQVARALDHAFRQGIVHRDIKPSNILIKRDGTVKLTDMGLARSVDDSANSELTSDGTTVGTVDYIAPEQARDSRAADIRSDIYSLGCTWYYLLTASVPFPKGTITNKIYAHIEDPRPDPRQLNKQIPDQIANTIRRMMARSPKDRQQTPAELLDHLEKMGMGTRSDPGSAQFASALSEVVEPIAKAAQQRVTVRTNRNSRYTKLPLRNSEELLKTLRVFGFLFVGLLAISLAWWVLVQLIPRSSPETKQRESPFVSQKQKPLLFRHARPIQRKATTGLRVALHGDISVMFAKNFSADSQS